MLSLSKITDVGAALGYYADEVELGREEYYDGEGEAPGRWVGSGAPAAGFEGPVEAGELEHLLGGAGLRRPVRDGAVAGIDLTFKAPKSVGVLWGIANAETARQLGEAHDAAVQAALGYMEREACRARRGAGGAVQVRGKGFVAAAFRHASSRAGDPLLHTHVVAGNLTLGPDGKWTALDGRHLYRHAKTGGYLYQAELRREITERLGLRWGPVANGAADVDGVSRSVIEHFSRRQQQMREHMAEHGGHSAQSAQIAVLETRRSKSDLAIEVHVAQWRARAAEHGLDRPAVAQILERGEHDMQLASDLAGDRAMPLAGAVVTDALTREVSTFGRPELLQALAAAQPAGAAIAELEQLTSEVLAGREIVALPPGRVAAGLVEPRFTTREMLATEQDLLDYALDLRDGARGFVSGDDVEAAFHGRELSPEQRDVVSTLCRDGAGVAVLRAPAGTGKTFVLDAAREAWQARRIEVVGCALSARAALELSDQAAIPSLTIAQLTGRLADGDRLPKRGVLVVDEAGMVGTRDLAHLAKAADQADAKLVLVGDDRQLPELQAGGAFHALAERLPASELHEVRRQREAWDRSALEQLRSGEVERWARAYRDHGHITVADSNTATRAALVNDWSRADGDRLMIAARRDDVRDLNDRARQLLQAQGVLGPDEISVAGRGYSTGDRVIGTRNDRRAGILNGQRATITATGPDQTTVDLRLDNGTSISLGSEYLEPGHLEHGYAITAHRAQGATVDRTFVLGSEELYREWSYTAMSRHREQARFYVTGSDLQPDRDQPPPHDPIVAGISRLVDRRHVKELAVNSLPQAQREQLEQERRQLRERLAAAPPPDRSLDEEQRLQQRLEYRRDSARHQQDTHLRVRENTSWRERRTRSNLDHLIAEQQDVELRFDSQLEQLAATREAADTHDHTWLSTYGAEAARLLAVTDELHTRDTTDHHAAHRVQALDRDPLPTPRLELDNNLDLGL